MANYRGYAGVEFPTAAATDDSALNLGLEFYVTEQAWFLGGYTWQPSSNSPSSSLRTGVLWEVEDYLTGTLLAQAQMSSPPTAGENLILLDDPVELVPNQRYRWGVLYPNGRYVAVSDYYASGDGAVDKVVGPLIIPSAANATGESVGNGRQCTFVESAVVSFPTSTFQSPQYGLDILVTDTDPTPVVGGELKTRADLARENMLSFLSLDPPQLYSNVDLMRLVLETSGQDLVTETSASIATHYARYAGSL